MEYLIEMHFHTDETSPCAVVPAKKGISELIKNGYSGVVVTDHYMKWFFDNIKESRWEKKIDIWSKGYRLAAEAAKGKAFKVILGMELTFKSSPNDYLVYGVTLDFLKEHPKLYDMTPEKFFDFANAHHLLFVQAHPFRSSCTPIDPKFLHGIEVFNGNPRHNSRNNLAFERAQKNEMIMTSGSDYHNLEDVGTGGIYFTELPESSDDIVRLLQEGSVSKLRRR